MSGWWVRLFACFTIALCLGCSDTPDLPELAPPAQGLDALREIYEYIQDSKLPLPKKPADFDEYLDSLPGAYDRIKNGEITVAWGFGLSKAPAAAKQVLAYETKAATEGGSVLLRDGTVKQMTAAEFNAAPKAK